MKRIITLMLSAALTFALVAPAAAVEYKGFGDMSAGFVYLDNVNDNFSKDKTDHLMAHNRVRIGVEVIASENLKGIFYVTTNNMRWGDDARFGNVTWGNNGGPFVRQAYLDWRIPGTPVRLKMGEQIVVLPGAMGSPILHTALPALTANIKATDNVSVNLGWARVGDTGGAPASGLKDQGTDIFFATVPLSFGAFNVTPWGSYAVAYKEASASVFPKDAKIIHVGVNVDATVIEKLRIRGDLMYGGTAVKDNDARTETKGFFADLKVTYKTSFGDLGGIAWYSSGGKKDKDKGGHIPTFGGTAWGLNSTEENGFGPTSFLSYGNAPLTTGQFLTKTGVGTLGIGPVLENVSFVEKLAHNFRLVYWKGTIDFNNRSTIPTGGAGAIDKKTSYIEANIDSRYTIYPGFITFFEIGFAAVNWSKDLKYDGAGDKKKTNGYRAGWSFHYAF